jgi:hypothetical protein
MAKHAKKSPSSYGRWSKCPGSIRLTADIKDKTSPAAEEGTAAHWLAEQALRKNCACKDLLGATAENGIVVDQDMVFYVQGYVDYVNDLVASTPGAQLLIEQKLPIAHLTGEEDATGTSDVVVLVDDEIIVVDLKYGRGVAVTAEGNGQLQMYALGAMKEFGVLYD